MRRHMLIAAIFCIALTALSFGFVKILTGGAQQVAGGNEKAGSLREAAKRRGHVISMASPNNLPRYEDVATLARDSDAVIIGTVEAKNSRLVPPAEKSIITGYRVSVQDVLKGSLQPKQFITLRGPGGKVVFEDGTSAEVKLPDYWKDPEVGKTYILFLRSRKETYFFLVGGPQGSFEIMPNGKIKPQTRTEDQLMQNYNGTDQASFLDAVRQVIERQQ